MIEYLFPLFTFAFLLTFVSFAAERLHKLRRSSLSHVNQYASSTARLLFITGTVLTSLAFCVTFIYTFLPELYKITYPLQMLDNAFSNGMGRQLIKISFIWIVIVGFRISYKFSTQPDAPSFSLIFRSELLMLIGVTMLLLAIFLYIPSVISLVLALYAFCNTCLFLLRHSNSFQATHSGYES